MKPCQGKAAFEVLLKSKAQIDINDGISTLRENGYEVVDAGVMLVAKKNEIEISIYPSAKLLIKCNSKDEAAQKANEIYRLLGVPEPL
jgi:ribonuclease HIII